MSRTRRVEPPRGARALEEPAAAGGAARPRLAVQRDPARVGRRTSATVPHVAALGRQLRAAGAVGRGGLLARRHGPRARHPQAILDFEPRILPEHAARSRRCSSPGALDHHNVIGVRDSRPAVGAAGAARVPGADRDRSRDRQGARSRISLRRGCREWTRACSGTTTSSCSTCARWAPSSPSSFRRSPRGSACTASRSPTPTSSGCSKASRFSPRACS